MFRNYHAYALGLFCAAFVAPVSAQLTPPPPEWTDGTSVYLEKKQDADAATRPAKVTSESYSAIPKITMPANTETQTCNVASLQLTQESAAPNLSAVDHRRLAPPSSHRSGSALFRENPSEVKENSTPRLIPFGLPLHTTYLILSALAIVVGLFLIFAWLLRRGKTKSVLVLPTDVVSNLGRVPLSTRQFAELLRVGNKLVLVSFTPAGAETITEVTDPVEVDRIIGICQQNSPHSSTNAFEQVFRQLTRQPSREVFSSSEMPPINLPMMDAFRSRPAS